MALKGRIDKLEKAAGVDDGYCRCEGKVTVVWDGEDAPPDVCPRCGRAVRVIDVSWGDDRMSDTDE